MTLNPRQQRFVEEYLVDLDAGQAAVRAGYKPKTARYFAGLLIRRHDIQEAILTERKRLEESPEVDARWVIQSLRENVERALQRKPVTDSEGNETGVWTWQGNVANRALELIGKHLGMFGDSLKVSGDKNSPIAHQHVGHVKLSAKDIKEGLAALAEAGITIVDAED